MLCHTSSPPQSSPSCRSCCTPPQQSSRVWLQPPAPLNNPRRRRCHAVSKQQHSAAAAAAARLDLHAQPALVERMFDDNWRTPLAGHDHPEPACRPVLALGKFDALHRGHQALAAAALQLGGSPVLLSFSGMAAVLGWAPRKPLVAPCDRPRVLHLWAQQLAQQQQQKQDRQQRRRQRKRARSTDTGAGASDATQLQPAAAQELVQEQQQQQQLAVQVVPVRQRYIPFAAVRSLSPEAFVSHIANDFKAAGVVSGINYRFGYRAAGDADLLKQLCGASGLSVAVVEMVGAGTPGAVGPVSSTKIREMLDSCRVEAVKRSLGRPYRLVADVSLMEWQQQQQQRGGWSSSSSSTVAVSSRNGSSAPGLLHPGWVFIPNQQLLNQQPAAGIFLCDVQLFVGASAHNDLLQLEQGVRLGASSSSGSSGSGSSSSSSSIQVLPVASSSSGGSWCIRAAQQEVEVVPDGLLVPQALWEAAESCLNNNAPAGSSQTVITTSSSSSKGADPVAWDTDDREDEEGASAGQGVCSALLVLDIQSCLMQMCSIP